MGKQSIPIMHRESGYGLLVCQTKASVESALIFDQKIHSQDFMDIIEQAHRGAGFLLLFWDDSHPSKAGFKLTHYGPVHDLNLPIFLPPYPEYLGLQAHPVLWSASNQTQGSTNILRMSYILNRTTMTCKTFIIIGYNGKKCQQKNV